jgi:hypothetical protein
VDLLSPRFFSSGSFQGHAVVAEIIRTVQGDSGVQAICHIALVPIVGPIAYLAQETTPEGVLRTYAEQNIRKWVREQGTAPFTRERVTEDSVLIDSIAPVPLHQQPRLPQQQQTLATTLATTGTVVPPPSCIHLSILGDRSGSMISMRQAAYDGIQNLLNCHQDIYNARKIPTRVSLSSFDNCVETYISMKPIENIQLPLSDELMESILAPRGGTALYDAIYKTAEQLRHHVQEGEKGIFAVMTDGFDTCSSKTSNDVCQLLEQLQRDHTIECLFLAANIGDAAVMGASLGFSPETSLTFSPETAATAFSCMNESMRRSSVGGSMAFTRVERQSSAPARPNNSPKNSPK